MITLFENFNDKIRISDYITNDNGVFKIPNLSFNKFSLWFVENNNPKYNTPIRYNTLMRFYIYMKLLNYKGDNTFILNYKKGLIDKDPTKIEIINKLPNNKIVMKHINDEFNLGYPIDYTYDNLQDLKKFINNYDKILSDNNLIKYIGLVSGVTKTSKKSEKIFRGILKMFFGKYYEVVEPNETEDMMGIDIWMINRDTGDRRGVQVKNIAPTSNFSVEEDETLIKIENTSLDIHPYRKGRNDLPYDYLCLFIESTKKACLIKSTAIASIQKYYNNYRIRLYDWSKDPKFHFAVFKYIDVPPKFLPKDTSKIFYDPTQTDLF